MSKPLYKSTIVIWSPDDPMAVAMELSTLARDAEEGESYCSRMKTERIEEPEKDPDWDGTDFFDDPFDEDEPS